MRWINQTKRGYCYDKRIFWAVFILTTIAILYIFSLNGFDFSVHPYTKCEHEICKNPFYGMLDCRHQLRILFFIPLYTTEDCRDDPANAWIQEEFLQKGDYGTPPPDNFLYKYMKYVVVLLFLSALVINHLIHNRDKKFDLEIPITKKFVINRDWLEDKLK